MRKSPNQKALEPKVSVTKRADGRYEARIERPRHMPGQRRRHSEYGRSGREAKAKALDWWRSRAGQSPASEGLRVGAYLVDWVAKIDQIGKQRPNTRDSYRYACTEHIIPALGDMLLSDVTADHIETWIASEVRTGYKPSSVRHWHRIFCVALNRAAHRGLIPRNPGRYADLPPATRGKRPIFSVDQGRLFLEGLEEERLAALHTLAIGTALRIGELSGLRWAEDIDLADGTLTVHQQLQRIGGQWRFVDPKSQDSVGTVALPLFAVQALRRHLETQTEEQDKAGPLWHPTGLVFATPLGTPLSQQAINRDFHRISTALGLPRIHYHDLRHTTLSLLLALGVDIKVIQSIARHSSIQITGDIYTQVDLELQRQAMAKLDRALSAPPAEPDSVPSGASTVSQTELPKNVERLPIARKAQ